MPGRQTGKTFGPCTWRIAATLGCDDELYLDGSISSLYTTQLGRADHHAKLGPMFAVVE